MAKTRAQPLPVALSHDELRRLLDACACDRDRVLVLLCTAGMARIGEALGARVADLTPTGIRLLNEKQRGPAQKHVELPADVREELGRLVTGQAADSAMVGRLGDGGPLSRTQGWRIIVRATAAAGIYKRHSNTGTLMPAWPHTLRHTGSVLSIEAGMPLAAVQQQLGHADLKSTAVYLRLSNRSVRESAAKVAFLGTQSVQQKGYFVASPENGPDGDAK